MLRTRVMPCLLLVDGRLVKTIKFKKPSYIGDPINAIKIYNEKEVDELIFLDITATAHRRKPPFNLLEEVAGECFMPFTYGGGVRTIEDMKRIYALGVEKIAVNSFAIENPDFVKQASALFGSQSVVVSIDVKKTFTGKFVLYDPSRKKKTAIEPVDFARRMQDLGAGEILLNSVDRDGTMDGFDIDLIRMVTDAVSIPVIACGGAGVIHDFEQAAKKGNASAIAAGSMFIYQGKNRAVLINFPTRRELAGVLD